MAAKLWKWQRESVIRPPVCKQAMQNKPRQVIYQHGVATSAPLIKLSKSLDDKTAAYASHR